MDRSQIAHTAPEQAGDIDEAAVVQFLAPVDRLTVDQIRTVARRMYQMIEHREHAFLSRDGRKERVSLATMAEAHRRLLAIAAQREAGS